MKYEENYHKDDPCLPFYLLVIICCTHCDLLLILNSLLHNTSTRKPHKKFYMPHFKECNSARRVQQLVIQFFFVTNAVNIFWRHWRGRREGGGPASNLTIFRKDYYPPPGINKSPHLTQGSNMPKYLRNAVVLAGQ